MSTANDTQPPANSKMILMKEKREAEISRERAHESLEKLLFSFTTHTELEYTPLLKSLAYTLHSHLGEEADAAYIKQFIKDLLNVDVTIPPQVKSLWTSNTTFTVLAIAIRLRVRDWYCKAIGLVGPNRNLKRNFNYKIPIHFYYMLLKRIKTCWWARGLPHGRYLGLMSEYVAFVAWEAVHSDIHVDNELSMTFD